MSIPQTNQQTAQNLWTLSTRFKSMRMILMGILVVLSWSVSFWLQYQIYALKGISGTELVLLGLYSILTAWLWFAFWSALIGFVLTMCKLDPLSLTRRVAPAMSTISLKRRHAVVMPVYNEETDRVMVGFESCIREIANSDFARHFDFYLLSDTQDSAIAEAELRGWQRLRKRLQYVNVGLFYRRREQNVAKKVGNIADFCQRWGHAYDGMVVLDADSMMSGEAMIKLAARLEATPDAGLIQTVPLPVRQTTLFGRFAQFSAHLYTGILSKGLSFWQSDNANYWGHNAIVRIAPFMQHCGLPDLPGKAPFGGQILSHDFVEAALLRRAGWHCYLITDETGSYEEMPANLPDYAQRDRRWMQGNLQHLRLLNISGLTLVSRLHFTFGALAYLTAPMLLVMLVLGSIEAYALSLQPHVYFESVHQLFPVWPVSQAAFIHSGVIITISLLLLPKCLAFLVALFTQAKAFGGRRTLTLHFLLEVIMAALIAPVMLYYHSVFVVTNLTGYSVRWEAQCRSARYISLRSALSHMRIAVLFGLTWLGCLSYFTPALVVWMLPVVGGFITAPLWITFTSFCLDSKANGTQPFAVESDVSPQAVIRRVNILMPHYCADAYPAIAPALPASLWQPMLIQNFQQAPVFEPVAA